MWPWHEAAAPAERASIVWQCVSAKSRHIHTHTHIQIGTERYREMSARQRHQNQSQLAHWRHCHGACQRCYSIREASNALTVCTFCHKLHKPKCSATFTTIVQESDCPPSLWHLAINTGEKQLICLFLGLPSCDFYLRCILSLNKYIQTYQLRWMLQCSIESEEGVHVLLLYWSTSPPPLHWSPQRVSQLSCVQKRLRLPLQPR